MIKAQQKRVVSGLKTVGGSEAELPIRYCFLNISRLSPCNIGWGSLGDKGLCSCADEPMEKNCHCIVYDTERIPSLRVKLKVKYGGRDER